MNRELIYLLLIFGLLVIPRALQRFKIPAPITCLVFGIGAMLAWGVKTHDPVVTLLSTPGISSLFLFAGLEVDLRELRRGLWPLLTHLAVRIIPLAGAAWLAWHYLDLGWQASALLALRSEGHTSELQPLVRLSCPVFCLNKKKNILP